MSKQMVNVNLKIYIINSVKVKRRCFKAANLISVKTSWGFLIFYSKEFMKSGVYYNYSQKQKVVS